MQRLSQSFKVLQKPKLQQYLQQQGVCKSVREVRRRAHHVLVDCFYGKWVAVPMDSFAFLERNKEIRQAIISLEPISTYLGESNFPIVQKEVDKIIWMLESFDY